MGVKQAETEAGTSKEFLKALIMSAFSDDAGAKPAPKYAAVVSGLDSNTEPVSELLQELLLIKF